MLFGITSGIVVALIALAVYCGVMKGRKYEWEYSAVSLANIVISAIIAALASSFIGQVLGNFIFKKIVSSFPTDTVDAFNAMPTVSGLIGALTAMLIAPLLFYAIFSLVRGIIAIFVPLLACMIRKAQGKDDVSSDARDENGKKISKKKALQTKKGGIAGMILGGFCALCMFIALATPITTYLTVADGVMKMAVSGSEKKALSASVEVVDAVAGNIGTKTIKFLGGDILASCMTNYKIADQKSNLIKESKVITSIGNAVYAVKDKSCDRAEAASVVREVGDAFEKTRFIPSATAELLDAASGNWKEGKKFIGISGISLGGSSTNGLMNEIYETFDGSTVETAKKDARTIANIIACMVEEDAFDSVKGNFVAIFENEGITQKILFELLDNDHLGGLVNGFMSYGIDVLCDALDVRNDMTGIYAEFLSDLERIDAGTDTADETAISNAQNEYQKLFDKYGIKVNDDCAKNAAVADASGSEMSGWMKSQGIASSDADFDEQSVLVTSSDINIKNNEITDKAAEAVKLAKALHTVTTLSDELKGSDDTVNIVTQLGPVLDAFSVTETVGPDCTGTLLLAILQSDKICKKVGFDHLQATEIADSINTGAKTGGYVAQMTSLGQMVDVLQSVSKKENSRETVGALLKDLTPETAKTMQTVATPGVMKENGVPEKSAEPAASMMSDMLGGLSDAKTAGMSEEQLDNETSAVNNVLNIAMNIDSSQESVFGEESATGVSVEQYVDDIMNSEVVSQTIIDHVYGEDDTPNADPLNTERKMSEAETNDLLNALNNKWQNASAEERANDNFNRSIVATAALVNVQVSVTSTGVVLA